MIYKSQKGKDKITFKGYSYRKSTTNVSTQNWRCDQKCPGSLSTPIDYHSAGAEPVECRTHNHPPDPATEELKVKLDLMSQEATTSNAPPRRIISDTLASLSEEAQAQALLNQCGERSRHLVTAMHTLKMLKSGE